MRGRAGDGNATVPIDAPGMRPDRSNSARWRVSMVKIGCERHHADGMRWPVAKDFVDFSQLGISDIFRNRWTWNTSAPATADVSESAWFLSRNHGTWNTSAPATNPSAKNGR